MNDKKCTSEYTARAFLQYKGSAEAEPLYAKQIRGVVLLWCTRIITQYMCLVNTQFFIECINNIYR